MRIRLIAGWRIMYSMNTFMMIFEILGTISFSVSGAILAMKKRMDILGVMVLGLVTAVGGGILRDILMGQLPPVVFINPQNAVIALASAFLAFVVGAILSKNKKEIHSKIWNFALLLSDAIGLGVFTVLGIRYINEQLGHENPVLLMFVGVVTGVGGGVMRDIFAGNIPFIFVKHVYATASIAGTVAYLCLEQLINADFAAAISIFLVVSLRLLAANYKWNLPSVHLP